MNDEGARQAFQVTGDLDHEELRVGLRSMDLALMLLMGLLSAGLMLAFVIAVFSMPAALVPIVLGGSAAMVGLALFLESRSSGEHLWIKLDRKQLVMTRMPVGVLHTVALEDIDLVRLVHGQLEIHTSGKVLRFVLGRDALPHASWLVNHLTNASAAQKRRLEGEAPVELQALRQEHEPPR